MRKLLLFVFLVFSAQLAWAIDIDTAKAQGLVGEANTGYLAAVKSPPSAEVRALISSVNAKRKSEFKQAASQTTATVAQVRYRFYELAIQRTKRGHYYQDASGNWKKK